jgi:DEAD/DEAH box helicase domain-containing protein
VGTSATIGKGEDSVRLLTEYASAVFGEAFSEDSVITENRLT